MTDFVWGRFSECFEVGFGGDEKTVYGRFGGTGGSPNAAAFTISLNYPVITEFFCSKSKLLGWCCFSFNEASCEAATDCTSVPLAKLALDRESLLRVMSDLCSIMYQWFVWILFSWFCCSGSLSRSRSNVKSCYGSIVWKWFCTSY